MYFSYMRGLVNTFYEHLDDSVQLIEINLSARTRKTKQNKALIWVFLYSKRLANKNKKI